MSGQIKIRDGKWKLVQQFDAADCLDSEPGTFTLPFEHPAGRWLIKQDGPQHLSVDMPAQWGGWTGVLTSYEIKTDDKCPHCEHCRQPILVTHWRVPPASTISVFQ